MKKLILSLPIVLITQMTMAAQPTTATLCLNPDLPASYEELKALEKQQYLWEKKILPTSYATLPDANMGFIDILFKSAPALLVLATLNKSFDHQSDEIPYGRVKIIHTYGSVAKIEWEAVKGSPYTGIFNGACGLARLSLAGPPQSLGYTPGMALKFFIDGNPSVNLHVMNSVNGQGEDQNFFAKAFSNIIPPAEGFLLRTLETIFKRVVDNPNHLHIHHLAAREQNGLLSDPPLAPYQLIFEPSAAVKNLIPPDTNNDFRVELSQIPSGTALYEVWAKNSPDESEVFYIGRMITRSDFIASQWGDENLFFKHQQ